MTAVIVHRASPIGSIAVPHVEICIHLDVPDLPPMKAGLTVADSLAPMDTIYLHDAKAIAAALLASLPGGTFDRLIVELLTMKASHFRVPWGSQ